MNPWLYLDAWVSDADQRKVELWTCSGNWLARVLEGGRELCWFEATTAHAAAMGLVLALKVPSGIS